MAGRLTSALCDGSKSYKPLCDNAVSGDESTLINLNTVNGFHSMIKEVLRRYRGVATKYQHRYDALFAAISMRTNQDECDPIRHLLTVSPNICSTNAGVKGKDCRTWAADPGLQGVSWWHRGVPGLGMGLTHTIADYPPSHFPRVWPWNLTWIPRVRHDLGVTALCASETIGTFCAFLPGNRCGIFD